MTDYTVSLGTLLAVPLALLGAVLIAVDITNLMTLELGTVGIACLIAAHGTSSRCGSPGRTSTSWLRSNSAGRRGRMHSV